MDYTNMIAIGLSPKPAAALRTITRLRMLRTKTESDLLPLLARVADEITTLVQGMNSGALDVDRWQAQTAAALIRGHVAAYLAGRDQDTLTAGARKLLTETIGAQIDYLNRFADEVAARGWQDGRDRARAQLYVGALKGSYWRGATFGLAMPFYPGDGSSECKGNCGCRLEIAWLDAEELNADVYWKMGKAERHCTTCPARAANSPYRFRGGELQ